MVIQV